MLSLKLFNSLSPADQKALRDAYLRLAEGNPDKAHHMLQAAISLINSLAFVDAESVKALTAAAIKVGVRNKLARLLR